MKKIEELRSLGWDDKDIARLLKELKQSLEGRDCRTTKKEQENPETKRKKNVTKLLLEVGCPFNIRGKDYLRFAILYCMDKKHGITGVNSSKELYPAIAKEYDTTVSSVERTIRHAVSRTCENGSPLLEKSIRTRWNNQKRKLTNREFISLMVEYLTLLGN